VRGGILTRQVAQPAEEEKENEWQVEHYHM
jgi:hypothetical protein